MSSEMWWGPWAGGRKMTSFRGCRVLNARGTGMLSCKKNLMVQGNDTKLLLFFLCVILNILRMLEVFGLCFVLGVVDVTVWNTGIMQYDHRQSQPKLTDLPDREVSESSRKRNYFSLFFSIFLILGDFIKNLYVPLWGEMCSPDARYEQISEGRPGVCTLC